MESKDIKILAIVGMSGSGKSTAIDYLTERKIPKVYFGGIIYKAMDEAGIERTPENDQIFRKEIREREGNDFVVKRAIKEVQNLIAAGQKRIALDGLYSWTEYKILRKEFPTEMTVIAIVTPKALRRKRLAARTERPLNAEEAAQRDIHEIEDIEKGGPIAIADYYVDNSKDVDTFHQEFGKVLDEIGFWD
jgi:dephospho-CoA kinase